MIKAISKPDWKLFQEKLPQWQEQYMGRLLEEYIELLNSSGNPSDRFWKLEKRIKDDTPSSQRSAFLIICNASFL